MDLTWAEILSTSKGRNRIKGVEGLIAWLSLRTQLSEKRPDTRG